MLYMPIPHKFAAYMYCARTLAQKVCGYAYVGGGLKIIRAEISLDNGKSWELADLTRPEDSIAEASGTDRHWCWSRWENEVDAARLKDCQEICCRAVDQNQNMQPTGHHDHRADDHEEGGQATAGTSAGPCPPLPHHPPGWLAATP